LSSTWLCALAAPDAINTALTTAACNARMGRSSQWANVTLRRWLPVVRKLICRLGFFVRCAFSPP
jgi:hypothetical protein